ncbi:MAG: hypothetical protein V1827_03180 [Candidatus Micrarchaeota archaeon]
MAKRKVDLDKILSRSELAEEDAERIGHMIKHEIAKRFLKKRSEK